ncbi:MAG TPA: BTAD domain-containing putative transcriptional regulator [Actinocrinis sp.]|nr:BTAD domain-containing putative transcriptional regulator [Actinocrinis sp.]
MKLGILGPLLVVGDHGGEIRVAAPRQRTLLAALLVHANRMVPVDELVEIVWDSEPPVAAARTLRAYMMRLRLVVGSRVASRILTHDTGYLCQLGEDELDALRFEALCREGGEALKDRAWHQASDSLAKALGLWRGSPLADIAAPILHRECAHRLEQARLRAVEQRAVADLHLGLRS